MNFNFINPEKKVVTTNKVDPVVLEPSDSILYTYKLNEKVLQERTYSATEHETVLLRSVLTEFDDGTFNVFITLDKVEIF